MSTRYVLQRMNTVYVNGYNVAVFQPDPRKIERWHQTLKNRVLLENYFLPGDLERQIEAFIEHHNHRRTLHSPGHV